MKLLRFLLIWVSLQTALRAGAVPASDYRAAGDYALQGGFAFLVQKQGELVVERYANGSGPDSAHRVYSLTKNLWALAAAAAERERILRWDESVGETLTEWQADPRRNITVRDLLSMTSGIESGGRAIYFGGDQNYSAAALSLPLRFRPGKVFDYGPGPMEVFGELLERKMQVRGSSAGAYLTAKVLRPEGIAVTSFKKDASGGLMFSSGTRMTARNVLRLGQAVLRVAGKNFAPELFRGTPPNPGYGLTFWMNRRGREISVEEALLRWKPGDRRWRDFSLARKAPYDLIASIGSRNQRLYVVPSMDLIIVRLGDSKHFDDAQFWRLLME